MPVGPHDEWIKRYGGRYQSDYKHPPAAETLRHFAETDKAFIDSCLAAGVKPTKRQASKFRRKMGAAYAHLRYAVARPA